MIEELVNESDIILENRRTEYNALRAEIIKRMELRYQFLAISLTIAGVFIGVGINDNTIALVYPPPAIFLAIGWSQNDIRISDLAEYIREHIEKKLIGTGWEFRMQQERINQKNKKWRLTVLSYGGIFLITQLMAILVGVLKFSRSPIEWILLVLDLIAIYLVVMTVNKNQR